MSRDRIRQLRVGVVVTLWLLLAVGVRDSGSELYRSAVLCLDHEGEECLADRPPEPGARDVLVVVGGLDSEDPALVELAFDWVLRLPSSWQPFRLVQVACADFDPLSRASYLRLLSRAARRADRFQPDLVILSPESGSLQVDSDMPLSSSPRWGERKFGWLLWPWGRDPEGKPLAFQSVGGTRFLQALQGATGERLPESRLQGWDRISPHWLDRFAPLLLRPLGPEWTERFRPWLRLSEVLGGPAGTQSGLRAIGPPLPWRSTEGARSRVLVFDAKKHHPEEPTLGYQVEVRWLRKSWKTCVSGVRPYPCSDVQRMTFRRRFEPQERLAEIRVSQLDSAPPLLARYFCSLGMEPACLGSGVRIPAAAFAEERARVKLPYELIDLPLVEWFSTVEWRVARIDEFGESQPTEWMTLERVQ